LDLGFKKRRYHGTTNTWVTLLGQYIGNTFPDFLSIPPQ
jgi:hypothetical protein